MIDFQKIAANLNPEIAKALRAIDRAYDRKLRQCADWPMDIRGSFMRKAEEARREAYERVGGWM